MQEIVPEIYIIGANDENVYWRALGVLGLDYDREHYEKCFQHFKDGRREIILAKVERVVIGFCVLNWVPKYVPFRNQNLPEIQDLNVDIHFRRRGIGRQMITFCEGLALERGYREMGIGVGMDASFGSAQRLYVKMGYIPDGLGVNYDRKQIAAGEFRPIDENLCLMMTKILN